MKISRLAPRRVAALVRHQRRGDGYRTPAFGAFRPTRLAVTAAVTATLAAGVLMATASPAAAVGPLTVTPALTFNVTANTTRTLANMRVSGDSTDTLQVTVSTDVGTVAMPVTTGLELSYNNHWSGDQSITFTGLQADIDTALASVELVAGDNAGQTAHVSLTATVSHDGYVYLAPNQHFYQYVPVSGIRWGLANAYAQQATFEGQHGYLATIPNDTVNDFISSKIQGAQNVWFGAQSIDTPDADPARTWQWSAGPLAGQAISYCSNFLNTCDFENNAGLYSHWADGEPNNNLGVAGTANSGEWAAVTNWQGSTGEWNDLSPTNSAAVSGYVVEYGDKAIGSTGFFGVVTATATIPIVDVPGAPTGVTATAGNGAATVSFTAPAANGSPIGSYVVTTSPGGGKTYCYTSPCLVTGLTNGTAYTFTVQAISGIGTGDPSDATLPVTPAGRPSYPRSLEVTPGDRSAQLSFLAPDDNGSPITGYMVSLDGGATWQPLDTAGSDPITATVSGLTNGTPYHFVLRAVNAVGAGAGMGGGIITPATVPGKPNITGMIRGDGLATVSFDAPDNGGSPITGYVASVEPGGITTDCSASPCEVGGLTNGTPYTVTVTAQNHIGPGDVSDGVEVTPAAAPDAPGTLRVNRSDQSVTVSFSAPADNGSALTGYQYTVDGGTNWQTLDTSGSDPVTGTVTGLTNGAAYNVAVRAVNDVGPGLSAGPASATPATTPGVPTNVAGARAGARTVSVSFTAPDNGGDAITGYTVTAWSGGTAVHQISCTASPCSVSDLTDGTPYTFTVQAANTVGTGSDSVASSAVVPATVPGTPTDLAVTSSNGALGLSFTAPADNGGDAITGYQASVNGGHSWAALTTTGDSPLTAPLTGLDNGTIYHVLVRAVNAVGASGPTGARDGKPVSVPDAPRSVHVSESGTTAVVSWTASAGDGGSSIVRYTATASPGGAHCVTSGMSCKIAGLPTGKAYTFTVTADNTTGTLPGTGVGPAGVSTRTMISGRPDAPKVTVIPGDRVLRVHFTLDSDGMHRAVTAARTARSVLFTGLRNGSTYRATARAVNSHGAGPAGTGVGTLRTWFHDPVPTAQRRHEVAVPKRVNYWGHPKNTTATGRSHNGTLAMSAGTLHGRQLQPGQAVQLAVFRFDSAALTRQGRSSVAAIAHSLRYAHSITCEGYTDYGGEAKHERTLAQRRAHAACAQLARDGVRIHRTVRGYGASRPVVIGGRPANRAANRRVIVVVNG